MKLLLNVAHRSGEIVGQLLSQVRISTVQSRQRRNRGRIAAAFGINDRDIVVAAEPVELGTTNQLEPPLVGVVASDPGHVVGKAQGHNGVPLILEDADQVAVAPTTTRAAIAETIQVVNPTDVLGPRVPILRKALSSIATGRELIDEIRRESGGPAKHATLVVKIIRKSREQARKRVSIR